MGNVPLKKTSKPENEDELVLTPAGWLPKSKVRFIKPGQHIDGSGGKLKIVDTATGEVVEDLGEIPAEAPEKPKNRKPGGKPRAKKEKKAGDKTKDEQKPAENP